MHMNKKEYRVGIRFRGEGETNKEAEARIKKIKKIAQGSKTSFADIVRVACDQMDEDVLWPKDY